MSYASDRGLYVGGKIEVTKCDGGCFNTGDILILTRDDGSENPWFVKEGSSNESPYHLLNHRWKHYKEDGHLKLLPVGAEVKIAETSQYYEEDTVCNPKDTKGVLIRNIPRYDDDEFTYQVRWDEDHTNCYGLHDLVLWEDTEGLEGEHGTSYDSIDLAKEASIEPIITITQEVKYTVVIKGVTFTFTQGEIDELAEELLGFTTL